MTEFLMDFGLREWLFVLGPIFIVGILVHGYWRMYSNRHRLKMALDKTFVSKPGEELPPVDDELAQFRAELPNGGARVRSIPEQTSLDLEQEVPVLMNPVAESIETLDEPIIATRNEVETPSPVSTDANKLSETNDTAPEKYVVIYVIAISEPFKGQALLENLLEQNMTFGEMDIFHRLDGAELSSFSLVNAVEPGTFDIRSMADLETPGVSLFMRVHELTNPIAVFENMIAVAEEIAHGLGGEVKDQSRSVMTGQTIEHCKLEISEYQLKYNK